MKRKVFYGVLVCLYVIFILVFINTFFYCDINEYVKLIYSMSTFIIIVFLIIYLVIINFKRKIKREQMKENFWNSPMFDLKSKFTPLIRIFLICSYIIFSLFVMALFGICFFNEGNPEKIDGLYYLTSHNDIVREISYQEYRVLSLIINQGLNSFTILVVETALIATKKEKFNEV